MAFFDTDIGAVGAESSDRVILPTSIIEAITGPLLRQGGSPWSWYDETYLSVADSLGSSLPEVPGSTLQAGTVAVVNGSTTITGTGTNFTALFAVDDYIVIYYPGGQRTRQVASRTATTITFYPGQSWDASPNASGLSYGRATQTEHANWASAVDNWNYYDVVLAQYRLFYRTGNVKYRNYARTLADGYWAYTLDSGQVCNTGTDCQPPRNQALLGMMMRALDGRSDMWPGIVNLANIAYGPWLSSMYNDGTQLNFDLRESGYVTWYIAMIATAHPDSAVRATYLARCQDAFTQFWQRKQYTGGAWKMDLFASNPSSPFIGIGTLPWQFFAPIGALMQIHALTNNPQILTVVNNALGYLNDQAYESTCTATRYATEYTTCSGSPCPVCTWSGGTITCVVANPSQCSTPQRDMESRALNQETVSQLGFLYSSAGINAMRDRGELIFGRTFGSTGTGSNTDGGSGNFDNVLQYGAANALGKEVGQTAGVGRADSYLVYRNGSLSTPDLISVRVTVNIASVVNATQARVTVTQPSGAATVVTCAGSPCTVSIDRRQGPHQTMIEYLSAGGVVLASSEAIGVRI